MTRNIVFVCLDTVRKDFFDKYARRIQRRADTSFEQTRSASCWTVPSHTSILTGDLPSEQGVHSRNIDFSKIDRGDTIFDYINKYNTVGISANNYTSTKFGFGEHFDVFIDIDRKRYFQQGVSISDWLDQVNYQDWKRYIKFLQYTFQKENSLKSLSNGVLSKFDTILPSFGFPRLLDDGGKAINRTTKRVLQEYNEPLFLYINFMEAHAPRYPRLIYDNSLYELPVDWSQWSYKESWWDMNLSSEPGQFESHFQNVRQIYRAEIEYLDRLVDKLIEIIENNTLSETTIIITSDHGENLGYPDEDFTILHTSSLSEGVLHVPFVMINPPDGYDQLESQLFSQLKLPKLISGIANNSSPNVFNDKIAAETIGVSSPFTLQRKIDGEDFKYLDRMIRGVYRNKQKYVWDSLGMKYEYEIDCSSSNTQSLKNSDFDIPERIVGLFNTDINVYKEKVITTSDNKEERNRLPEKTIQQLKELGYM